MPACEPHSSKGGVHLSNEQMAGGAGLAQQGRSMRSLQPALSGRLLMAGPWNPLGPLQRL